MVAVRTNLFAR